MSSTKPSSRASILVRISRLSGSWITHCSATEPSSFYAVDIRLASNPSAVCLVRSRWGATPTDAAFASTNLIPRSTALRLTPNFLAAFVCDPHSIVASKYCRCLSVIGMSNCNSVLGSILSIPISPVVLATPHTRFLLESLGLSPALLPNDSTDP